MFSVSKHGHVSLHNECKTNGSLDARLLSFILDLEIRRLQIIALQLQKVKVERRHQGTWYETGYSLISSDQKLDVSLDKKGRRNPTSYFMTLPVL